MVTDREAIWTAVHEVFDAYDICIAEEAILTLCDNLENYLDSVRHVTMMRTYDCLCKAADRGDDIHGENELPDMNWYAKGPDQIIDGDDH